MLRLGRVLRIAPQRVVVTDAMRIVANVVARGLVAPWLDRARHRLTNAAAKIVEPFSVIFGNSRVIFLVGVSTSMCFPRSLSQ